MGNVAGRRRWLLLMVIMGLSMSILFALFMDSDPVNPVNFMSDSHIMAHMKNRGLLESRMFPKAPGKDLSWGNAPQYFDPQSQAYLESLLLVVLPGIFLSIASLVAGIVFVIMRFIFNSCGSKIPRPEGYGPRLVLFTRLGLLLIVGLVLLCASFGFTGNDLFSTAVKDFMGDIVDMAEKVADIGVMAYNTVYRLNYAYPDRSSALTALSRLKAVTSNIRDETKNVEDTAIGVTTFRWVVLFVCFELGVLAAGIGGAAAIYRRGTPAMVMALMGFFILFLLWIVWSVHFALGIFTQDFCIAVDLFVKDPESADSQGVQYFVRCLSDNTFAASLENMFDTYKEAMQEAQDVVNEVGVATDRLSQDDDSSRIIDEPTYFHDKIIEGDKNMTEATKDVENDGAATEAQKEKMRLLQEDVNNMSKMMIEILGLLNCQLLRDLFDNLRSAICGKLLLSLYLIQSACYGGGLAMTLGVILGIRAFKSLDPVNFRRNYRCPVHNCNRWFRFKTAYVAHVRVCRSKHWVGKAFNAASGLVVGFYRGRRREFFVKEQNVGRVGAEESFRAQKYPPPPSLSGGSTTTDVTDVSELSMDRK
eukprot:TRINITY_DN2988_c2_g1_i1.p1 TRINITY_DN2988_c2_g1~~TRINITY_DN2988_c2_g1_i1.p1  ORF type:complete len:590 (+),score=132.76 TRINITY_DN2988_c2_g1_i1:673-2442(+)